MRIVLVDIEEGDETSRDRYDYVPTPLTAVVAFTSREISSRYLRYDASPQWRHFSQTLGGLTFHTQLLLRVGYCNA